MEESMIPEPLIPDAEPTPKTRKAPPKADTTEKAPEAVKTRRMKRYAKPTGPALVIEHPTEHWRTYSGNYKSDEECRKDAARTQKKRPDVKVTAGRWENWGKS